MENVNTAIRLKPAAFRSIEASGLTSLPLFVASVKAGFPSPATDHASDPIDINTYFTSNLTTTFLVEVEGDSMIGAYIEPGDTAVVDVSLKPVNGKIVIAFINGEFTIKRLRMEKEATYLEAENPKYQPIVSTNRSW